MYALFSSNDGIFLAIFLAAIPTFNECFTQGPGFKTPAICSSISASSIVGNVITSLSILKLIQYFYIGF